MSASGIRERFACVCGHGMEFHSEHLSCLCGCEGYRADVHDMSVVPDYACAGQTIGGRPCRRRAPTPDRDLLDHMGEWRCSDHATTRGAR